VWTDDADPSVFFGEDVRARKVDRKAMQLCKQVERAMAATLATVSGCDCLLGASVAGVEPAPDASRMRAIVVLAPEHGPEDAAEARTVLGRWAPEFRAEVAAAIHRKRVPEIVFDVRPAGEVGRE
jgi:ribosome-binding factor A